MVCRNKEKNKSKKELTKKKKGVSIRELKR